MYNLNYTYLTNLEVDTRQTFADISDDLILLNNNSDLKKANAKTLISSWQDFFWKSDVSKKRNMDVIFTDITVIHNSDTTYHDKEMLTQKELSSFFKKLDDNTSWCKTSTTGYTFNGLVRELSSAINILNRRMTSQTKTIPTGFIVIADANPSATCGFGEWREKNASYIAENVKSASHNEIQLGFNNGKADGKNIGSDRTKAIVKNSTNGKVPKHEHKLTFVPESGDGGSTIGPTSVKDGIATYTQPREGKRKRDGESFFSGYDAVGADYNKNHQGLLAATDAWSHRDEEGSSHPTFSVSETKINPSITSINVAPKTYPIDSKIWERAG